MPSNATETIDVRILRLIGLEDTFDLDYDTYLTLLKEAAVKGRMPKTEIPIEEIELLTDELKRVKSKKDKGRFKVKKKKITSTKLKTGGILTGKKTSIPTSKLLSAAQAGGAGGFNIGESFAKIAESVTSIANTLRQKNKLSKKDSEFDRRTEEREKRKLQKQNLKKRFAKMAAVAQKILKPVQSLLDKIINYFTMIFLGRVVIKLLNWFSKDENKKKVKSFVRFIGDWWPALLGGFLLFGTGIGGLIATFVPTIVGWTVKLAAVIGGSALLKTALAAAGLVTAGAWLPKLIPGLVDEDVKPGGPGDHSWGGHEDQQRRTTNQAQKGGPGDYSWGGYEDKKSQKIQGLSGGGWIVPGSGTGDTVSAMLTPGESVLQVGARERLIEQTGVDPLSANIGPNANKPKIMGGTMFASSGGMVGKESGSYRVPSWNEVGASVMSGLSGALNTLNIEGAKLHGFVTRGNYGLSGGSMGDGGILSNLNKEGAKLHGLLTRGNYGLNGGDGINLQQGAKELYQTGANFVNQVSQGDLKDIKGMGMGLLSSPISQIINSTGDKGYQEFADRSYKKSQQRIKANDSFIKGLPEGPFREMMDKGLIPIPSGDASGMRNLTFLKAMLGPLGRPFRILTNDDVTKMRQETITRTLGKDGLRINKDGTVSMDWNRVKGKGSGAYTDDFDSASGGSAFNSILGRWNANTEGNGNTLYTDDVYNFNKEVSHYAAEVQKSLMEGAVGDAGYMSLAMLGRFAQDLGWLNQRALGSRIEIGEIPEDIGKSLPQAQISPQQKPKTAPLPPHTSVIDPIHGHEITTWGGGTGEWPSDPSPATPTNPVISMISGWADKLNVLGLGG